VNNLLSCFFPTTVVLVDDRSVFLDSLFDNLTEIIPASSVTFKKFTNPAKALNYINEICEVNRLDCSDLTKSGEDETSEWKSIMLNINCLHREIYSFDRFSLISAVVVDYSMPGMTGTDFCSNIKDKNIQKILLTGVADEKIAIGAFNNGHISRFVKKGVNLEIEVADNINKSIYQYFKVHTDDVSKHLSIYDKTHLKDPVFANFFFNTCLSRTYVEYYMLDTFGGYLFLNAKGQPSLLSVLTENEMNRIVDIGLESGEVSPDIIRGLQSREYMLVSHNRSGQLPPLSEWENYLKPARRLNGYQTYYFSFAGAEALDIDFDNIKAFDKFKS
jgi:CheY-like chemotaxis protein